MQEVFEKIIKKFIEKCEELKNISADIELSEKQKAQNHGYYVAMNHAEEIVNQASAEYNNGWIPSDNPPKNEAYILLSFENFSVPLVGRYEEDENGGAFYIGDEEKTCTEQDIIVNAWQPLPEPYQPKGE